MYKYEIHGGYPIKGSIRASGNKNAALPCIAATLLTDQPVILRNLPDIEDVQVMFDILRFLGARVVPVGPNAWQVTAPDGITSQVPSAEASRVRAAILFAGPLLARTGRAVLAPPGGDVIGRRRLDTHFLALQELGAAVEINGQYTFQADRLIGTDIFLDEASVTATENAIMAAALADGTTTLRNAASEPHVQDLCRLINAMGGQITGIGSNILTIEGRPRLHGADYQIGPDFMEIGSFIGLAAVTRGELTIENVQPDDLRMLRIAFAKLGIQWRIEGTELHMGADQALAVNPDFGGQIPKIDDAPWPGFPPDLTSIITVVATQVEGTVLVHEKLFESRMFFVDKLIGMGARIILCDPHLAVVSGPAKLHGSHLVSPDVRAGMAMVIAAMCAEGTSTIHNVYQIERGYENLVERLTALGAHIRRLPDTGGWGS